MSELLGKMAESLIAGKIDEVVDLTREALDGGAAPVDILDQGLLAGMDVVGQGAERIDTETAARCQDQVPSGLIGHSFDDSGHES